MPDDKTLQKDELGKLARGGSLGFIGVCINALFGLVLIFIISHTLNVAKAGAVFEAIALFTICSSIGVLGADSGLLRFTPLYLENKTSSLDVLIGIAMLPVLAFSVAMAVGLVLAAPALSQLLLNGGNTGNWPLNQELAIMAPALPLATGMTVALAAGRAWTIRTPVIVQYIFVPFTRILFLAVALIIHISVTTATLAWVLPYAPACAIGSVTLLRMIRRSQLGRRHHTFAARLRDWGHLGGEAKIFWSFSLPRSLGGAFQVLISWLDVLLVGGLLSSSIASIYTVASRYVTMGTFPLQGVQIAIAPQISRLFHGGNVKAAGSIYRMSTAWVVIACWPLLLSAAVFAPTLMKLFGAEYGSGAPALTMLAIATLATTWTGCSGTVLTMSGNSVANLIVSAIALIANVTLNLLLISSWGLEGAATAWVVSILVTALLTSWFLYRDTEILPFGRALLAASVLAILCYGVGGCGVRAIFGSSVTSLLFFEVIISPLYLIALRRWAEVLMLAAFRGLVERLAGRGDGATLAAGSTDPLQS